MKKTLLSKNALRSLFWCFALLLLLPGKGWGQTLYDSFSDGNFTASPTWGGDTTLWGVQANSDAAAGATGANTIRQAGTAFVQTDYLSSQITSWATNQEWGFWVGRKAQAYTAANKMYIWLYANESTLNNATVDGYRLSIGDDIGGDEIRLEYVVNGAVSSTVIASSGAITNGVTDIGFLLRVTRSSAGVWTLYSSSLPTANGTGAIATDVPNSTNASVSQGSATENTLVPANNGYLGFASLHSTGANAIIANEIDQIYFIPSSSVPVVSAASPTGTVGTFFSYSIVATNSPTSYAVASGTLPDGLTLNTTTSEITGTPTAAETQTVGVTATNAGGTSAPATLSFTINAAGLSQTITFNPLSTVTYGDAPFGLTATADSGLTVTYASSNTAVATVSGSTVTIVGAGSTNITASQSGNGSHNAAAPVVQALTLNPKALTIPDAVAASRAYNKLLTTNITGTLTGIINLDDVTFVGTLKGTFADANVASGKPVTSACTLTGTKAANYSLTQPPGLTADITKATQTITLPALANKAILAADFSPATSSTSLANPITYSSSNTAVATIVAGQVHIVAIGSTTITASQAGDSNYFAATDVTQALTVVNNVIYLNEFNGAIDCTTTGNAPVFSTNATGTPLARNTITCTSVTNQFNSTTLNNTAVVNDASYIEFSATAASGYRLNLTSLSFYRQASGSAPNSLEVRYSIDNWITSTSWGAAPVSPTSGTIATWDFADFSSANAGTVAFRIYPYGTQRADLTATAAAPTGTFRLDDVTINGTVFPSNMTLIPDSNFEQALIDLTLDSGPIDGQVLTSRISGIIELDIRDKKITSLVGIKEFTSLQNLFCNNEIVGDGNDNAITALDVSGMTNLKYFYCQNNLIANLNISGLASLEALDTSNNPFSSTALDVHLFPNLYYLICQNNGLTSLNISGLTNLQTLITWHNSLSSLDLSANLNLSYLDCDDNAFTSINVAGLTTLESFYCSDNQLSAINVSGLTNLKYFYCNYNQLPAINVSGLTNLIEFYCNDNQLTSLYVKGLTNLDYFDSTNNPLTCILVDDVAAAYTASTTIVPLSAPVSTYWAKDAGAIYSNCDCGNTTTWNGISWDNGAPTSAKSAIIEGDYNLAADIIACSLTVNNNAAVTIPSGSSVSLNGALTVSSGSFTLENNANLIQSTNVANSGNITVKRNSALQVRLDHTLWSSPVTGTQTLIGFSPNTLANRFYNFDTATNKYAATSSTGTFTAGKGVAVRAPNDYTTTPTTFNGVFTGLPNNGPIAVALNATAPGNNLLGNPYPSTIDAAAFVNVANNPAIGGTLYFYAHTLSMDANGIFPAGTNYAVWNSGSGGTAATLGTSGVPANVPNGIIQTGQGFFVQATGTGNVNFTNAMRVNNTVNQFFKTSSTKKEAIERHRIWLNLTNGAGTEFNQILVAYAAGATQDADRDYDGLAFGNSGSALSSKIAGADYAIQGRALPFSADDVVALGFKAAADGNYTISLSAMDGLFLDSQEVLIRDNTTGTVQSLKGTPYTFASTAGVHDSRFELMYSKTLGVSKPAFDTTGVVVYKKESAFHVNTNGIMMKEISVFDMRGRLIAKQSNINGTTSTLSGLSGAHGVLLLKIVSDTNETLTIKVMN